MWLLAMYMCVCVFFLDMRGSKKEKSNILSENHLTLRGGAEDAVQDKADGLNGSHSRLQGKKFSSQPPALLLDLCVKRFLVGKEFCLFATTLKG